MGISMGVVLQNVNSRLKVIAIIAFAVDVSGRNAIQRVKRTKTRNSNSRLLSGTVLKFGSMEPIKSEHLPFLLMALRKTPGLLVI